MDDWPIWKWEEHHRHRFRGNLCLRRLFIIYIAVIIIAHQEELVLKHGKSVYRLDGDNIRTGLNRDLGFSKADRAESVRRVGELACLFSDAGTITIVSLVSPYESDRNAVRQR